VEPLVYVLEDDPALAGELLVLLGLFGYHGAACASSAELGQAWAREAPAALVVDMVLGGVDFAGVQAMKGLAERFGAAPPVLFMSRRGDHFSRLAAVRGGGSAYLPLPVQPEALHRWLEKLTRTLPDGPLRVLIIDEDEAAGQDCARLVREAGLAVRSLADPRDAFQAVLEFHPDVVVLAWGGNQCSGPELAAVLRQEDPGPALPMVFLARAEADPGILDALHREGDDFLVRPVAGQRLLAAVIARAQRHRAIIARGTRDGLTGLANHRRLKEELEAELARAKRSLKPMAFALLDLDHFRLVNDRFGHPAGDAVLKSLARVCTGRVRLTDHVGRYGGDAFAAVLPDTTGLAAMALLEAIRKGFGALPQRVGTREFQVTVSGGIAAYPDCQEAPELQFMADQALLAAKQGGRDRLILAGAASGPRGIHLNYQGS
jgi:diguanylate cyclase (GGDEF)-like protein